MIFCHELTFYDFSPCFAWKRCEKDAYAREKFRKKMLDKSKQIRQNVTRDGKQDAQKQA